MNPKQTGTPPPPTIGLGDIYYVLFRRKWMIVGATLCGFIAAGITYFTWDTLYSSTAKLYIDDIIVVKSPTEQDPNVKLTPTGGSGNALNSEVEFITSLDNLTKVAANLTPARITAKYVSGTNVNEQVAAQLIQQNLAVDMPRLSQVIWVTFKSRSMEIVQPVLEQVITNYIDFHLHIHQRPNAEWFNREILNRETRLKATEGEIRDLKDKAGIVGTLDAEEKAYKQQETLIQQENYMALAELEESRARAAQIKKLLPGTNETPATNAAAAVVTAPPSEAIMSEYQKAKKRLVDLEEIEAGFESRYTTNNLQLQANLVDIQAVKTKLRTLEDENPGLLSAPKMEARTTPGAPRAFDPEAVYQSELYRIQGLEAKTNEFARLLDLFSKRGVNLNNLEGVIENLERDKALQEEYLKKVSIEMNSSTVEADVGNYRGANINEFQHPGPPVSDLRKSYKIVQGIAIGGVLVGFGLAFFWDMVLDRTLKRPKEVVERLKLPFFLNIPHMKNGRGRLGFLKPGRKTKLLTNGTSGDPAPGPNGSGALVPVLNSAPILWDDKLNLRPFLDTLRDRLVAYFEMLNLTHKPKLVAVTSCGTGAGVSTISAGLARSLSETGEGNVLLVDMNSGDGVAHHFSKGKLAMGLDDILEKEKANRQGALVQENLYVVKDSSNQDRLPGALPKRFSHLVSQLKASDYDYILLDMPPVTEISITPRLARFMDTILLVVESGKTGRDAAQRATALLSEGRATVGVVMNKSRSYVPKLLQHEL